mmetsp:Transcript_12656/g.24600  ORF Transcript_12656/g.24600 Transcript_12656/m.24600 type:complete len:273 (+) Transcript_12656:526-1344(+)
MSGTGQAAMEEAAAEEEEEAPLEAGEAACSAEARTAARRPGRELAPMLRFGRRPRAWRASLPSARVARALAGPPDERARSASSITLRASERSAAAAAASRLSRIWNASPLSDATCASSAVSDAASTSTPAFASFASPSAVSRAAIAAPYALCAASFSCSLAPPTTGNQFHCSNSAVASSSLVLAALTLSVSSPATRPSSSFTCASRSAFFFTPTASFASNPAASSSIFSHFSPLDSAGCAACFATSSRSSPLYPLTASHVFSSSPARLPVWR